MSPIGAERYRRLQLAVRARALAEIALAWRLFGGDLESWRAFDAVAKAIIRRRRRESAGLARARLREVVEAAGAPAGLAEVPLPPDPPDEKLTRSLAATGLAGTWRALAAGASLEEAREVGLARVSMAAGRHVLDGGRELVVRAAMATAGGEVEVRWRRIAGPKACAFCKMLAGRGAVYRADTVHFRAHDGCACIAEPGIDLEGPAPPEIPPKDFPEIPAEVTDEEAEALMVQIQAWARARMPHVQWDIVGVRADPRAVGPFVRQLVELMEELPGPAAMLRRLYIGEAMKPGVIAWAGPRPSGEAWMGLNEALFTLGHYDDLRAVYAAAGGSGWLAVPRIEGTAVHEFGHVVHFWVTGPGRDLAFHPLVRASGFGLVSDTFGLVLDRLKRVAKRISGYAPKDHFELWAEAFAATRFGVAPPAVARRVRAFAEVLGGRLLGGGEWRWFSDLSPAEREEAWAEIVRVARRLGFSDEQI